MLEEKLFFQVFERQTFHSYNVYVRKLPQSSCYLVYLGICIWIYLSSFYNFFLPSQALNLYRNSRLEVFCKKVFLKILQNLRKTPRKDSPTQVFPCLFCKEYLLNFFCIFLCHFFKNHTASSIIYFRLSFYL